MLWRVARLVVGWAVPALSCMRAGASFPASGFCHPFALFSLSNAAVGCLSRSNLLPPQDRCILHLGLDSLGVGTPGGGWRYSRFGVRRLPLGGAV